MNQQRFLRNYTDLTMLFYEHNLICIKKGYVINSKKFGLGIQSNLIQMIIIPDTHTQLFLFTSNLYIKS